MTCRFKRTKKLSVIFLCLGLFLPFADNLAANAQTVIPGGEAAGIILNCGGVLVTGTEKSYDIFDGSLSFCGIEKGDVITAANGKKITCADDLNKAVEESRGKQIKITVKRNGEAKNLCITPEYDKTDKKYRLGILTKDSASGIGTITYYDPKGGSFAMLGHGISNPETDEIFPLSGGAVVEAEIADVEKGKKGIPGELRGTFYENGKKLGKILSNNGFGIFGTAFEFPHTKKLIETAEKSEIKKGGATILATLGGKEVSEYDIEILKINQHSSAENKNMLIKVIDKRLKDAAGGIVQGMSGAPIIQNGKLIGAVTHVFVNDPEKGYGVFIENMLAEAEKIK